MKAVITGATGAVGMALIAELIKNDIEVLVLARPGSARNERLKLGEKVKVVGCDLKDLKDYKVSDGEKYDWFFHFGWIGTTGQARNDMHLQNKNVEYTLDAVNLAQRFGCSVFMGAGSQAEYGRVEGKLSDKTPTNPEMGYGIAKLCAGRMSRIMCEAVGMRHIWVRILSVYGPYDNEVSMVISTLRKMIAGETPEFTAGEQIWDYMYSEDAAKAIVALAERGHDGDIYCLGSGKPAMLKEYIIKMRDAANPACELGLGKRPYAQNQVMYLCADTEKLTADTGFVPSVSFDEGIAKTVAWVRADIAKNAE
ncbi:MAG: NAD(P)-dependent oxidoreductase [Clostridia bacterium]|nr:NAD(P)-dependent oxidoreductase [Clostridia bacterium]